MPPTRVVIYCEQEDPVSFLDWMDSLPVKAQDKCRVRLERLGELGHELRRPEADYLRDGVYELRASLQGVNYRVLYFFHGKAMAVLSHGLTIERAVPPKKIDRAVERKKKFESDPKRHTLEQR
jgi:phage-related protein